MPSSNACATSSSCTTTLTRRDDTPFWNHVRTMEVPDSLREKLALFGATGRLFRAPQDIFSEPSYGLQVVGQGLVPQAHQPLADVLSHDEVAFFLGNIEQGVARHAAAMPLHADYLAAHCRAA
ncbi:tryptophan 7-halogenase [Paucibacter sp. O1-1]|nr:tryptophan 7-halogenase [Paucibacter sp. O1-1]MDA3831377.1 tryptophan 7-halogenase [Paucibacter sp. O1-1]